MSDNNGHQITIDITDLGPIKDKVTIRLRPFMVISGPSNTGKSYLAMLIHFVYRILCGDELYNYTKERGYKYNDLTKDLDGSQAQTILTIDSQDMMDWLNQRARQYLRDTLSYQELDGHIEIHIPRLPDRFTFLWSRTEINTSETQTETIETLKVSEINRSLQIPSTLVSNVEGLPFVLIMRIWLRSLYCGTTTRTFFLPPSRGSLLALPDNIRYNMLDSMGMYQEFLNDLAMLKSLKPNSARTPDITEYMSHEILDGDIKVEDTDIKYRTHDIEIPLSASASSIKELMPLALMAQKHLLDTYAILFEEPESHLHPDLQVRIAQLIAMAVKLGSHIHITTHSDYIVRRLSDMIKLHRLQQALPEAEYLKICQATGFDAADTLDPEQVAAYYLHPGADGHTEVKEQDVTDGLPYDSFERVTRVDLGRSAALYDYFDALLDTPAESE